MTTHDPALPPVGSSGILVPETLQEPFRQILRTTTESWAISFGQRLLSVVVFGSVARRTARESSDIDLLVVAQELPKSLSERRHPFLEEWARVKSANGFPSVDWNLVVKSPEEARFHSPLYLDIVEDGIPLLDREGFFQRILQEMKERMRTLGSRRVFLDDGTWYWDLKPDFRFGEIVEI